MTSSTDLRAAFAQRMAEIYGREVPAYLTLAEVSEQVNLDVLSRDGAAAERLGSISRVTAERHGAIRVGTTEELRQVSRIFAAMGMFPVGFYDLREAAKRGGTGGQHRVPAGAAEDELAAQSVSHVHVPARHR